MAKQYGNLNNTSAQNPLTRQSVVNDNQISKTSKMSSIISILCVPIGLIIIGLFVYFIFFNGSSHSNISAKSVERVCKSMGYSEVSIDEMLDMMELSGNNPTGFYVTIKSESDIQRLAEYGFKNSTLFDGIDCLVMGGQGDNNNYSVEFDYVGCKTDNDASTYIANWMSINDPQYIAQNSKVVDWGEDVNPSDAAEVISETFNDASYYFIHYVLYGTDNISGILYDGTDIYILKATDVLGASKAQRILNDMCEALYIISPSKAFNK